MSKINDIYKQLLSEADGVVDWSVEEEDVLTVHLVKYS